MQFPPVIAVLLALCAVVSAEPISQEQLTLSAEARGVLAHNCTKCHGQQKQKGGLRLDVREATFKGGESGAVVTPGKPDESELLRRVTLPHKDDDIMPPETGPLEGKEIETLRKWIADGAPWPEGETAGIVFQRAPIAPRTPAFPLGTEKIENPIDRFVDAYFREQGVAWPELVGDSAFLRRASLDAIGLLPRWEDVHTFDGNRDRAVDLLLDRADDYAAHWMTFWNDALRNDYSGTGYIDGGRQQISAWLYRALETDMPYDQFVRELVTPLPAAAGFVKGIKWRGTVSAGQRVELQAAQNVAQVFLGLNLKCASCHDSFTSDYKLTDSHGLAAVFANKPLEVFRCDIPTGETTAAGFFWPELGSIQPDAPRAERQRQLAALITKPENGRLARTLVNRLWAATFGRGLIEPVDVMDNKAWNQDLLDWLASDLVQNGWKIKRTLRLILTSRAYQLPAVAVSNADDIAKASFAFRGPLVRRLSAEQFTDAVSQIAAPMYTKRDFAPGADTGGFAAGASWIWHDEGTVVEGLQYPEGKRYFRHTFEMPKGRRVKVARAVGTADNTFMAFINGRPAFRGTEWDEAEGSEITESVKDCNSVTIAVEADNVAAGAAGLRFALAIWFEGQRAPMVIDSGPGWRSAREVVKGWEKPDFDDHDWVSAVALGPAGLPWAAVRNFSLIEEAPLIRAALVKNDALQTTMGRPMRDQVVMSRPSQATLLQALTFTNGRSFTGTVDRAARIWEARVPHARERLSALYRTALQREPREDERSLAASGTSDLLWSLFLQPEFQLIH
jgi:hypothetical protein